MINLLLFLYLRFFLSAFMLFLYLFGFEKDRVQSVSAAERGMAGAEYDLAAGVLYHRE